MATNPFTGQAQYSSQPILTADEIYAKQKAAYDKQLAQKQASFERRTAALDDKRNQTAQQWVDSIAAQGGLSWDSVENLAYGQLVTPDQLSKGVLESQGMSRDELAPYYATVSPDAADWQNNLNWQNGGTQYGSIEGGSNWVPTTEQALTIFDALSKDYRLSNVNNTDWPSPQDALRKSLGNDVPDEFINYLAAQGDYKQPGDGYDPLNIRGGMYNFMDGDATNGMTGNYQLQPLSGPVMYGTPRNAANDAIQSLLSSITPDGNGYEQTRNKMLLDNLTLDLNQIRPQNQWGQIASGLQADEQANQQNTAIQNDAYQRYTLGNNYMGGQINDNYAQPFGGRLEGYDQNNPLAYFGWDGSRFGSPTGQKSGGLGGLGGFGAPQQGQQNQQQGFGSGWGGPWGSTPGWGR